MPTLAKVDTERQKRTPTAALAKIRSSHPGSSRIPDAVFRVIILLSAISVFAIVVLVVWELVEQVASSRCINLDIKFFWGTNWDPVNGDFGALPFIFGTLVSSILALILAVPLSVGVAVYITEMCPQRHCAPSSPSWLSFWLQFPA